MGERRIDDFRAEKLCLPFSHAAIVNTDTTIKLWKVPAGRSFRVTRVYYNNPTGLAGNGSNFANIKITDGTNIAANWSTDTGAQSTLTADTPVDLVLSATDANRVLTATEVLTLFLDMTGTVTLPIGNGWVEGYLF